MKTYFKKHKLKLVQESRKKYDTTSITAAQQAARLFRSIFKTEEQDVECFYLLTLNGANEVIGAFEVTRGLVASTQVHPREVYKRAILLNSSAIIVGHNHPTGSIKPSSADERVTKELTEAGKVLGIPCLDHIILGEGESFYSFAEA